MAAVRNEWLVIDDAQRAVYEHHRNDRGIWYLDGATGRTYHQLETQGGQQLLGHAMAHGWSSEKTSLLVAALRKAEGLED